MNIKPQPPERCPSTFHVLPRVCSALVLLASAAIPVLSASAQGYAPTLPASMPGGIAPAGAFSSPMAGPGYQATAPRPAADIPAYAASPTYPQRPTVTPPAYPQHPAMTGLAPQYQGYRVQPAPSFWPAYQTPSQASTSWTGTPQQAAITAPSRTASPTTSLPERPPMAWPVQGTPFAPPAMSAAIRPSPTQYAPYNNMGNVPSPYQSYTPQQPPLSSWPAYQMPSQASTSWTGSPQQFAVSPQQQAANAAATSSPGRPPMVWPPQGTLPTPPAMSAASQPSPTQYAPYHNMGNTPYNNMGNVPSPYQSYTPQPAAASWPAQGPPPVPPAMSAASQPLPTYSPYNNMGSVPYYNSGYARENRNDTFESRPQNGPYGNAMTMPGPVASAQENGSRPTEDLRARLRESEPAYYLSERIAGSQTVEPSPNPPSHVESISPPGGRR